MAKKLAGALVALILLTMSVGVACAQFAEQRVWAGTSAGTGNAQTITVANMGTTAPIGVPVRFLPGNSNSGATTLTLNGGTPIAIFKPTAAGISALGGGEIVAGQLIEVLYDGTRYQLIANNVQGAAFRVPPQGYLTPCNFANSPAVTGCTAGNFIPTSDVTSATTLYYGTKNGNQIPIYNGSNMVSTTFTELTLTIPSSRLANTIYDVCVFSNSGTPTAVFSVAWTTSTSGGGNRGTGAGTAQITQVQGVWVNAVVINGVNGATAYNNIPANQCTMVGTVLIDGTNGQVTFHRSWGPNRKWGVWNFYNRVPIILQSGDSTASWNYNTNAWRGSNNTLATTINFLTGLPEEEMHTRFDQNFTPGNGGYSIGIGWNNGGAPSGMTPNIGAALNGNSTAATAVYVNPPALGLNNSYALENGKGGAGASGQGTQTNMMLTGWWRG